MKLKDKFGNNIGSVDKGFCHDYNINDKYGNRIGSADKELFGSDYYIKDAYGDTVGKAEKNIFSDGYTVRDKNGRKKVDVKSSGGGADIGSGFAMVLAGVFILSLFFIKTGFEMLPSLFEGLFIPGDDFFYFFTIPGIVFICINIAVLFLDKNMVIRSYPALFELIMSIVLYLLTMIIAIIVDSKSSKPTFEGIDSILYFLIPLMYLVPAIVVYTPLSLVFGLIQRFVKR